MSTHVLTGRGDRSHHVELKSATVEYVAPSEYMVRETDNMNNGCLSSRFVHLSPVCSFLSLTSRILLWNLVSIHTSLPLFFFEASYLLHYKYICIIFSLPPSLSFLLSLSPSLSPPFLSPSSLSPSLPLLLSLSPSLPLLLSLSPSYPISLSLPPLSPLLSLSLLQVFSV